MNTEYKMDDLFKSKLEILYEYYISTPHALPKLDKPSFIQVFQIWLITSNQTLDEVYMRYERISKTNVPTDDK